MVQQTPSPVGDVNEFRTPRSLLTKEVEDAIVEATRKGTPKNLIAKSVGVDRRTMSRWFTLARREPDNFPDCVRLLSRVNRAFTERITHNVGIVQGAADGQDGEPGDWRAATWLLEKECGEVFSPDKRLIIQLTKKVDELEKLLAKQTGDVGN